MNIIDKLNTSQTIIIVGRPNSGTRIIPQSLHHSGVFMGNPLNEAFDLMPPVPVYEASRLFGGFVKQVGECEWDFTDAVEKEIPSEFYDLIESYLASFNSLNGELRGWKLPQCTLIYPWLTRILPEARYYFVVRHPADTIKKMTGTDRLEKFNIPCKKFIFHEWNYKLRVYSWKYHHDIVMNTPRPKNFEVIKFEDLIVNQDEAFGKISQSLNIDLKPVTVDMNKYYSMGRTNGKFREKYPFLVKSLDSLNYS